MVTHFAGYRQAARKAGCTSQIGGWGGGGRAGGGRGSGETDKSYIHHTGKCLEKNKQTK